MKIEVNGISKSYTGKKAVDNISFSAESGKAFGLLGRNGAGKTTTIRILMDIIRADSGNVTLDGKPIDYGKVRIGYLPEERGLYAKKEVFEQLVYLAELKGVKKKEAMSSVDNWLRRLGVQEYRNQQKIQFITALAHDPDILILDEPFSGLDPVNAMLLESIVKEKIAQNKLVLFSSHQMNYIEEFCDDIAIINKGKTVLKGSLEEIKRSYPRDMLAVRTDRAQEIVAAFPVNSRQIDKSLVEIKLPAPEEKQKTMQLLAEKFDPDEIRVLEPSLNDIFIEYTNV